MSEDKKKTQRATLIFTGVLLVIIFFGLGGMFGKLQRSGDQSRAVEDAREITEAIETFYADYRKLPRSKLNGNTGEARSNAAFMNHLTGDDISINKNEKTYFEGREAKEGVSGFVEATGGRSFRDPWGQEYWIVLDVDNNGHVFDPYLKKRYEKRAVVHSAGPDAVMLQRWNRKNGEDEQEDNLSSID